MGDDLGLNGLHDIRPSEVDFLWRRRRVGFHRSETTPAFVAFVAFCDPQGHRRFHSTRDRISTEGNEGKEEPGGSHKLQGRRHASLAYAYPGAHYQPRLTPPWQPARPVQRVVYQPLNPNSTG
jgi:hypothetical protein